MLTNKAIVIAKDIDLARTKGNWQAIPELARRFKKHNPNGVVLEQSILAECTLNGILSQRPDTKRTFEKDSPNRISLTPRLEPNVLKTVQQQLLNALEDRDSSTETKLYKQMSIIILAQTYFETGQYMDTLQTLKDVHIRPDASAGYAYTLYLQSIVMKAISLELLNEEEEALEGYANIVSFVNGSPNLTERSLVEWAEKGLYRATLFALSDSCRLAGVSLTMSFIRAYQKTCSSQSSTWRIYKRLVVTQYSLSYLANIYKADAYLPPVDYRETEEGKQLSEAEFEEACRAYHHQLFSIEIMQLHTVYEKLVYSMTHFPRSGQMNAVVLDFIDRLALDFALIGGTETEKRGFVEVLNRASLRTFNSPCVIRHLFHALVNLGDYEEAEHALKTYLYLVGLESRTNVDARATTVALASDPTGLNAPIPDHQVEALEIAQKKQDDPQQRKETAKDKINVLTTAVKIYCQELSKGTEAVTIAELAYRVYTEEDCVELDAQVHRALGVSYGFLASQTFDRTLRPQYHKKALKALYKSLEMDKDSWETCYQLALQLAEMRDIVGAVPMISRSLQLNPTYLPSWHLLALLCTCPIKESMTQALKTCELALDEASDVIKDNWVDFSEEVGQYILLQMTHTLLVGRVHGPEEAAVSQERLFQMFGKILVPELIPDSTSSNMLHESISQGNPRYGMVLSGSLGNIEPSISSSSAEKITRGRSASNASTFTTRSVSSFTGRKLHLAEMFDTGSAKSVKNGTINNKMLDPKGLVRKDISHAGTTGSLASFQSNSSSTRQTLLEHATELLRPITLARLEHQRSCKILCDLWLLSAESFLQHGKIEEALKAVGEAENVDWTTHAGVWCLLGRIRLAQKQPQKAITAFQKGLVTKPSDVTCRVWLAKTYIELGDLEIAEGILEAVTQENGWDNSAAWFYLGEIYRQTDRMDRTKDCFFYALELESTTPIQSFTVLPRVV